MKQKGFALIAVLGLLMILSLVATFIANYAEQRLEQAQQLRERLQSQLNSDANIATLLHIIATRPLVLNAYLLQPPATIEADLDISPLVRLRLDGQRYQGIGQSAFSLQDEGSLLSLIEPDRERWSNLFRQHGLQPREAERFLDQLQDYTDQDDLRRLNGASSSDYLSQGLAPPPQRLMISPGQIFNLLDAAKLEQPLRTMLTLATARSGQLHNLNTMPKDVLQSIPGIDAALAQGLIDARQNKPFNDLADANARIGRIIPLDPLAIPSLASAFVRIRIWPSALSCRQSIWLGISSTPGSRQTPWDIDYSFTFDNQQPCPAPQQLANAPLF